jgi:hypothetical protein
LCFWNTADEEDAAAEEDEEDESKPGIAATKGECVRDGMDAPSAVLVQREGERCVLSNLLRPE